MGGVVGVGGGWCPWVVCKAADGWKSASDASETKPSWLIEQKGKSHVTPLNVQERHAEVMEY